MLLAPKLGPATLNGKVLMYLAKCQVDEKPGIRVHTNICLGSIAGYLNPAVSAVCGRGGVGGGGENRIYWNDEN